mmetsp:Transcript_13758/g.39498  ORF Transcript_13758/g.39498 Transcript_13758/m.39498 type:complete len:297 (-) Transcript_13758:1040-1930(-)
MLCVFNRRSWTPRNDHGLSLLHLCASTRFATQRTRRGRRSDDGREGTIGRLSTTAPDGPRRRRFVGEGRNGIAVPVVKRAAISGNNGTVGIVNGRWWRLLVPRRRGCRHCTTSSPSRHGPWLDSPPSSSTTATGSSTRPRLFHHTGLVAATCATPDWRRKRRSSPRHNGTALPRRPLLLHDGRRCRRRRSEGRDRIGVAIVHGGPVARDDGPHPIRGCGCGCARTRTRTRTGTSPVRRRPGRCWRQHLADQLPGPGRLSRPVLRRCRGAVGAEGIGVSGLQGGPVARHDGPRSAAR